MPNFNDTLGLKRGDDDNSVVLDTRPEHQITSDAIHFAVLATVAEVAAARAADAPVVPAAIQISLLSRARPGRLVGRGKVLRRGRRLAVVEGEVYQDDELVAKAVVQFAVLG